MEKKCIILIDLLLVLSLASLAQTTMVQFDYDANGNRVSRTLVLRKAEENGRKLDSTASLVSSEIINDNLGKAILSIYPNPTRGKVAVMLQGLAVEEATVLLTSVTGAVVAQSRLNDGACELDLSGLPSGVYLLHISSSEASQTWKIVKK